jgi:hypothetical protein
MYLLSLPLSHFQHFPLFRNSDEECTGPDAPPDEEKSIPFKPQIDTLSREATQEVCRLIGLCT